VVAQMELPTKAITQSS
jgi:hypothetical protein